MSANYNGVRDIETGGGLVVLEEEEEKLVTTTITEEDLERVHRSRKRHPLLQEMNAEALKEKVIAAFAVVATLSCLLCIMVETDEHWTVIVFGVSGILIAPYSVIQQRKLTELEGLVQTNNLLQLQVAKFEKKNKRIQAQVEKSDELQKNLLELQRTLKAIQTKDLQGLEEQLRASQKNLDNLRKGYKLSIKRNLLDIFENYVDVDGDWTISDAELEKLVPVCEGLYHIQIDKARLRALVLENGRQLDCVIEAVAKLVTGETPKDNEIFWVFREKTS